MSRIDLSPIKLPQNQFLNVAVGAIGLVLMYSASVFLALSGLGVLKPLVTEASQCTVGKPCSEPLFSRLVFLSVDVLQDEDLALLPSIELRRGNGIWIDLHDAGIRTKDSRLVSAMTGEAQRVSNTLHRLLTGQVVQDSVLRQLNAVSLEEPSCFGNAQFSIYPQLFADCEAVHATSAFMDRLVTRNFSVLAAHLSARDFVASRSLDDVLHDTLSNIDRETLVILIHASQKAFFYASRQNSSPIAFDHISGAAPRIPQLQDIAPTLSVLLGIPIPFANEGLVIPSVLWHLRGGSEHDRSIYTRKAARQNLLQLSELAQWRGLNGSVVDDKKSNIVEAIRFDLNLSSSISTDINNIMSNVRLFPLVLSAISILSILLFSVFHLSQSIGSWDSHPHEIVTVGSSIGFFFGAFDGLSLTLQAVLPESLLRIVHLEPIEELVFSVTIFQVAALFISTLYYILKKKKKNSFTLQHPLLSVFNLLSVILLIGLFVSSSPSMFGVEEKTALVFTIQGFGTTMLLSTFFVTESDHRDSLVASSVFFMAINGIALYAFTPEYFIASGNVHQVVVSLFNFVLVLVAMFSIRRLYVGSDNLVGTSAAVSGVFVPLGLLIASSFWVLEALHMYPVVMTRFGWWINFAEYWIAKLGFLSSGLTVLYVWISDPCCVTVDVIETPSTNKTSGPRKTVHFRGIANGVGASYLTFNLGLFTALNFFQSERGVTVFLLSILQLLLLVDVYHVWRDKASLGAYFGGDGGKTDKPVKRKLPKELQKIANSTNKTPANKPSNPATDDLQRVIANPYLTLAFTLVMVVLTRFMQTVSLHDPSIDLFSFQMPSESSLGFGGMQTTISKYAFKPVPKTVFQMTIHAVKSGMHVYGLEACLSAASALAFVLWKRPVLSGTEKRSFSEIYTGVLVRVGVVSGLQLLTDSIGLLAVFSNGDDELDAMQQVFVVRGFGVIVESVIVTVTIGCAYLALRGYNSFLAKMDGMGLTKIKQE